MRVYRFANTTSSYCVNHFVLILTVVNFFVLFLLLSLLVYILCDQMEHTTISTKRTLNLKLIIFDTTHFNFPKQKRLKL